MINIPTIAQLYSDYKTQLEAELNVSIPIVGKLVTNALAATQAAKMKLFYYAIANLQKNIFVDTADLEENGGTLERFGRIKLGRNPFPATSGTYTVEITGQIGAVIPASTTFKSNDSALSPSKLFILDVAYTLVSTTDTIDIRALEAGEDSKLNIGDLLTATAPIINVNAIAEVTIEVIEPLSAEDIELYRQRTLDSFRLEPQGGAPTDYRLWSQDAQAVQQTYPYATNGQSNEVDVYVESTIVDSVDGKGTPTAGTISDVEDVIEFDPDTSLELLQRGRRPLGLFKVNVLPITPLDIDIDITSFVGITVDKQTAILNGIKELTDNIRPFVAGIDILADRNDTLSVNAIISSILNAVPGAVFGAVVLTVDGNIVNSYQFEFGDIPYLNSVNYV